MPIPWKKTRLSAGVSRLISAVRSKHRAASSSSPLVVQTGFPTSLADFVVKNRSRLKTPSLSSSSPSSRKYHQRRHNPHASPPPPPVPPSEHRADSFASPVSEEIITHLHKDTSSWDHSNAVSDDEIAQVDDEKPNRLRTAPPGNREPVLLSPVEGEKSNFSSLLPDPDMLPPTHRERLSLLSSSPPEKVPIPFTFPGRKGVGFQAKVILLLILAVCSKELVLGITTSALALLLLEYVGSRLLPLLRSGGKDSNNTVPASATRAILISHPMSNNLNSVTGRDGILSDDSNAFRQSKLGSSMLEQSSASLLASDRKGAILMEKKGPSSRTQRMKEESIDRKVKKKHWIKVVAGKFRAAKRGAKAVKDSTSDCSDASSRGSSAMKVQQEQAEGFGQVEEACDTEGDDCCEGEIIQISQNSDESAGVSINGSDYIAVDLTEARKISRRNSSHLFLFTVVLSGLIGGRIAALMLTVGCCYLLKFSGILARSRDFQQNSSISRL